MLEMYECEHEWTSWRLCKRGLILWIGTIHDLVKLLGGKKAFKNNCLKHEKNTSHPRYKARLEVRGFVQKKGVDYDQIFFTGSEDVNYPGCVGHHHWHEYGD